MTKQQKVVIGACFIGLLGCVVSYIQLNWYGRAVVVDFLIAEDWPLAWGARRHFEDQRKAFDTVTEFFAEIPEVRSVSFSALYPESLCAELTTDQSCKTRLDSDELRRILEALGVSPVFRIDRGFLMYIGSKRVSDKNFDIAYVYSETSRSRRQECSVESGSTEIGACDLPLDENWYLSYEWRPTEFRKTEQLLDE